MTTQIESLGAIFRIDGSQGLPSGARPGINIQSKWRDVQVGGNFNREDIIAAVETELGGVFIRKSDLPPVSWDYLDRAVAGDYTAHTSDTPESLRNRAYAFLALAETLENPQVTVLAGLLATEGLLSGRFEEIAEKLIATNKITVKTDA